MEKQLMVSVDMITYKHENFIAQAIEGVLMQETNFEFDLIIADDCSPDNTESIVRDLIASHPRGHLIKYFRHKNNIGMQPNGLFAAQQCKGKYVAICEGDDYWTDPLKLQKQVDFLEANEDYMLVAHNVDILKDGDIISNPTKRQEFYLEDFFSSSHLNTVSVVYRNDLDYSYVVKAKVGDWAIFLLCAMKGRVGFIPETYGVYRIHEAGTFSGVKDKDKKIIEILESFKEIFPQYRDKFQKSIISKSLYCNLYSFTIKNIVLGRIPLIAVYLKLKHCLKFSLKSLR